MRIAKVKSTLFAALLMGCLTGTVRAERHVGLEAQGVDPLAALHNPMNLDVRDALGRPVSAAIVAQELGLAARGRAKLASYASRLPKAKIFAVLVEFFNAAPLAALRSGGIPEAARRIFSAAPSSRPEISYLLILAFALPLAAAAALPALIPVPLAQRRSHRKIASLRI